MAEDFDFLPLESPEDGDSGEQGKRRKPPGKTPPDRPEPPGDEPSDDDDLLLPKALLELMPPTTRKKMAEGLKATGGKPAVPAPSLPAGDGPAGPSAVAPSPAPQGGESTEKVLEDLFPEQFTKPSAPAPEAPAADAPEKVLQDLFPDQFAGKPQETARRSERDSVEEVLDDLFAASQPSASSRTPAGSPAPESPSSRVKPDADTKRLEPAELPDAGPAPALASAFTPGVTPSSEDEAATAPTPSGAEDLDLNLEPDTRSLAGAVPVSDGADASAPAEASAQPAFEPIFESPDEVQEQRESESEPGQRADAGQDVRLEPETGSLEAAAAPAEPRAMDEAAGRAEGAAPVEPAVVEQPTSGAGAAPGPAGSKGAFGRLFGKLASAFSLKPRKEDAAPAAPEPDEASDQAGASAPAAAGSPALSGSSAPLDLDVETKTFLEPITRPTQAPQFGREREPALEPVTRSLDTPVANPEVDSAIPPTGRMPYLDEAADAVPDGPQSGAGGEPASEDKQQSATPETSDARRLTEWCKALEARIKVLSREKDALGQDNERLRKRVRELVAVIKSVEQAFVIGRLRRGQALPAQPVPGGQPGIGGQPAFDDEDPTRFDNKILEG